MLGRRLAAAALALQAQHLVPLELPHFVPLELLLRGSRSTGWQAQYLDNLESLGCRLVAGAGIHCSTFEAQRDGIMFKMCFLTCLLCKTFGDLCLFRWQLMHD